MRGDCQNTASRPPAVVKNNQLRAVFPGPLHNHIDGRTAALARAQRQAFDDHRICGPLVEADWVAVQRRDPRPRPRGPKQQVTAGLGNPQQIQQPGILIRVRARSPTPPQSPSLPVRGPEAGLWGLLVAGVLGGVQALVVLGLDLGRRASAQTVHQPGCVVPVHPRRGDVLQVGEGADRAVAKR